MDETGKGRAIGDAGSAAVQVLRARLALNPSPKRRITRPAPPSGRSQTQANDQGTTSNNNSQVTPPTVDSIKASVGKRSVNRHNSRQFKNQERIKQTTSQSTRAEHAAKPELHPLVWMSTGFINVLALAIPLGVLQVYDTVLPSHSSETLAFLIFGLAGVILVDAVLKITRAYLIDRAAMLHDYDLACKVVNRVVHAPEHEIARLEQNAVLEGLNAVEDMRYVQSNALRLFWLELPFAIVFLFAIWLVAGRLVLVPMAFLLISAAAFMVLRKSLQAGYAHWLRGETGRQHFVIEALANIFTIKAMAMEPLIQCRFEQLYANTAEKNHRAMMISNIGQAGGVLISSLAMVCVASVGAAMVIGGNLTMGGLGASAILSGASAQWLSRGLNIWTQMQMNAHMRGQVHQLLNLPDVDGNNTASLSPDVGKISLKHLSCHDSIVDGPRLENINLEIAPGSNIGFIGARGEGASTLLKLISGAIKPDRGDILMDGLQFSGPSGPTLAGQIAYVYGSARVFRGTLLENITMFSQGSVIDRARSAARLIDLEDDIHTLQQGYDTPLGQGITEELPAGMIQRIAIARAMALGPQVLLLDQADNSLDDNSVRALALALASLKGEMTVLIVSNRSSILQVAETVYEVSGGRLRKIEDFGAQSATPAILPDVIVPLELPLVMEG